MIRVNDDLFFPVQLAVMAKENVKYGAKGMILKMFHLPKTVQEKQDMLAAKVAETLRIDSSVMCPQVEETMHYFEFIDVWD
jgi:hypothetical protein